MFCLTVEGLDQTWNIWHRAKVLVTLRSGHTLLISLKIVSLKCLTVRSALLKQGQCHNSFTIQLGPQEVATIGKSLTSDELLMWLIISVSHFKSQHSQPPPV